MAGGEENEVYKKRGVNLREKKTEDWHKPHLKEET
jgi:hypothetical protein